MPKADLTNAYFDKFLVNELTPLPHLFRQSFGEYYNNALWNGTTWMLLIWYILHIAFDAFFDAFLKRMRYKEYIRIRLKCTLWSLGFYTTALMYFGATVLQNPYPNYQFDRNVPLRVVIEFIIFCTFLLHSAFWEGLKYSTVGSAFAYFSLSALIISCYIARLPEVSNTLTVLICTVRITLELTRCMAVIFNRKNSMGKLIVDTLLVFNIIFFVIDYLILIPLVLAVSKDIRNLSPSLSVLLVIFLIWLLSDVYNSVTSKAIQHWLYHNGNDDTSKCCGNIIECLLFTQRDDTTFNIIEMRKAIKEREAKMLALRKPKNRTVLMQTLKCMVNMKKRLGKSRLKNKNQNVDNVDTSDEESDDGKNNSSNNQVDEQTEEVIDGKIQIKISDSTKEESLKEASEA